MAALADVKPTKRRTIRLNVKGMEHVPTPPDVEEDKPYVLTPEQRAERNAAILASPKNGYELADEFGLCLTYIYRIWAEGGRVRPPAGRPKSR